VQFASQQYTLLDAGWTMSIDLIGKVVWRDIEVLSVDRYAEVSEAILEVVNSATDHFITDALSSVSCLSSICFVEGLSMC
jgi:hypothetical protein